MHSAEPGEGCQFCPCRAASPTLRSAQLRKVRSGGSQGTVWRERNEGSQKTLQCQFCRLLTAATAVGLAGGGSGKGLQVAHLSLTALTRRPMRASQMFAMVSAPRHATLSLPRMCSPTRDAPWPPIAADGPSPSAISSCQMLGTLQRLSRSKTTRGGGGGGGGQEDQKVPSPPCPTPKKKKKQ